MVTPRPLQMFRYAGKAAFAIACLGITNLVLQATLDWNAGYVGTEIVFTVFACVAMFAGKFIAFRIPQRLSETRTLLGSVRERSTPTTELFSKIGPSVMLLSLGLVIGVASLWTHIQLGIPWQAGPVRFFYLASVLLNFSFVGIVGGAYIFALWWLIHLSKIQFDVKPINWQRQVITCLANDYLSITGIGVVLYLLAILGVWLDPGGAWFIKFEGPVRNLWILPIAMCIAAYFCLVQFFIHRIVYRIKDARIIYLLDKQQAAFDSWEETREKCHAENVAFLDKLIESVSKEESWPFDLPKAATILLPVFLPATKEIVGLFSIMFKG